VLESLNQEKNTSRIVHIIKPGTENHVFKMGRGHESDLRINDISVSRLHAMIKFKDGKFLLEDNVSKFGTLVLINKRTPLSSGFNKAVQIGRSVINFSVKSLSSKDKN
jgi:pSer/pThr/pTyr-binding forkhead associated (FHA) protein